MSRFVIGCMSSSAVHTGVYEGRTEASGLENVTLCYHSAELHTRKAYPTQPGAYLYSVTPFTRGNSFLSWSKIFQIGKYRGFWFTTSKRENPCEKIVEISTLWFHSATFVTALYCGKINNGSTYIDEFVARNNELYLICKRPSCEYFSDQISCSK